MADAEKKTKCEKLLEKEEKKREKRIMKEKSKQYDGGFTARCVALLLGFVLGVVGTIGGAAGAGYYLVSHKSVKEVAGIAGGDKFDLDKYLSAEYSEKTLLQFFKDLGDVTSKLKGAEASISTLAEISPYVSDIADKLAGKLSELGLDVDADALKTTPFNRLSEFLQETVQNTRLGTLIGAKPDGTIMGLLCYGEEGVNYTLDEDGNITWIGDSHELSVKDFMDNGATSDVFNRLSLKAVMETNGSVNTSDPITRVLVYGTKGVDYAAVAGADGKETIIMLPLAYDYNEGTGVLTDDHNKEVTNFYSYDAATKVIALFGSETPAEGDTPSSYLYETDGKWYAYATETDLAAAVAGEASAAKKRILHKATTLGNLLKGDFMGMVEGVELASLLNVTADSEGTLLAIAYGNEGEDYRIETDAAGNKNIVMQNGAKPRTIKDLRDGNVKFEDLELGGILKIKPHDGSNETKLNLAYGEEGKHYTYDDSAEKITWLNKRYIEKTDGAETALYDADGKKIDGATKNGGEWTFTQDGVSYTAKKAGTLGLHTFYAYKVGETAPVTYKARTIADLKNLQTTELVGRSSLESLLGVGADTDGVLRSLAYGKQGLSYRIEETTDGNGNVTKSIVMLPVTYTFDGTDWKDENGAIVTPVSSDGNTYEFLFSEDGVFGYVYAENVTAAGSYPLCDAFGAALTHKKRSIDSLKAENATKAFNEIELRAIVPENTGDSINLYLLYGKAGIDYEIDAEGNVKMLNGAVPKTIGSLREKGENSIFSKLRRELTIGQMLGNVDDNKILKNLKDSTLDSLGADIKRLTVGSIFEDADSNKILKPLKYSTFDTLNDDIKNLKITDVFEDDIYYKNADGDFTDKNGNVVTYENKVMRGEWNYLLRDPSDPTKTPDSYTVVNMGALTNNMTENVKNSSVYKLNEDFNLEIDTSATSFLHLALSGTNLQTLVTAGKMESARKDELTGKHVGDLTIKELFDYIPTLIGSVPGV